MRSLHHILLFVGMVFLLGTSGCSELPTSTRATDDDMLFQSQMETGSDVAKNSREGNPSDVYKVRLTGEYVGVQSQGRGLATFRRQGDLMTYKVVGTGLSEVVSAKLTICGTVHIAREAVRLFSATGNLPWFPTISKRTHPPGRVGHYDLVY